LYTCSQKNNNVGSTTQRQWDGTFNLFRIYYREVRRPEATDWRNGFFFLISFSPPRPSEHHLPGISTVRILNAVARERSVVKLNDLNEESNLLSVCIAVIIHIMWKEWTPREWTRSAPIHFSITYTERFAEHAHVHFLPSFRHRLWFFGFLKYITVTTSWRLHVSKSSYYLRTASCGGGANF